MSSVFPTSVPAIPKQYFPAGTSLPQPSAEEEQRLPRIPYRQAVGSLLYLMVCTRPDLAYSVQAVSRHFCPIALFIGKG